MGATARVTPEIIESTLQEYSLVRLERDSSGVYYRFEKSDKDIATLISLKLNAEITRGQVNSFRRRHFIAGCRIKAARPKDSGWGGARDGAGRKSQEAIEAMELAEELKGIIVDYDSPGATKLLHWLCTWQLSQDCRGQGLVGGAKPKSPEAQELKEILRKLGIKKYKDEHNTLKERAKEIARTIGKSEVIKLEHKTIIEEIFEDADTGQGTASLGKKGKQGGRGTLRKIS